MDSTECGHNKACRNGNCVNPCSGSCGPNANCDVRNHVAVCSCPAGYKGDPLSSCRRMDPGKLNLFLLLFNRRILFLSVNV